MQLTRQKLYEFCIVFSTFFCFAFFKFQHALIDIEKTIIDLGDGLGGLHWLEIQKQLLEDNLFNYYISDFLSNDSIGMGYMADVVTPGIPWKLILTPLLLTELPLYKIYDLQAFLLFIAGGLSSYYLARVSGAKPFFGIFFGILILSLFNTSLRIPGHLSLAIPVGFLIQLSFFIQAAKFNSIKFYLLATFTTWLSFQIVEYYGYYGTIFSIIIFILLYLLHNFNRNIEFYKKTAGHITICSIIFLLLMFFSYPTLILGKLGLNNDANTVFEQVSYSLFELKSYTALQPGLIFTSDETFFNTEKNTNEFTFRVGKVVLFSIIISTAFLLTSLKSNSTEKINFCLKLIAALFSASLFLALMGLHPSISYSLSEFFFNFTPMFRVAVRTFMMTSVGVLLIFIILTSLLYEQKNHYKTNPQRIAILSIVTGMLFLVLIDSSHNLHKPLKTRVLSSPSNIHEYLANNPGTLIELPFYSPYDHPHLSYRYMYNWTQHHQTVVNAPFHRTKGNRPEATKQKLHQFSEDMLILTTEKIKTLGEHGIRYIIVNPEYKEQLPKSTEISFVMEENDTELYEITSVSSHNTSTELLNKYPTVVPDPSILLNKRICEGIIISEHNVVANNDDKISIHLTLRNNTNVIWGDKGLELKIGTIWMKQNRNNNKHHPNFGETWFDIKKTIPPKGLYSREITLKKPKTKNTELWISGLKPNQIWCFHLDVPATKIVF